jgi:hypothetical protein
MPGSNDGKSYYQNPAEYQKSIAKELLIARNRVRNLIGKVHWASDGSYKETILKNVLKRVLPKNLAVGSGFILRYECEQVFPSTQIDIIYDTSIPLIFQQDDFIITTSSAVKGIIEVKTKISPNKFTETIEKASNLDKFLNINTFNGIFSYENSIDFNNEGIQKSLRESKGNVNHLCLGNDFFIKYWNRLDDSKSEHKDKRHYAIYKIPDYSFGYFISNLVVMSTNYPLYEQAPFLFSIPEGKDEHRINDVVIDE